MSFWEFMAVGLGSAGLFASILGAFLTHATRKNGEATRDLIRSMEERMSKHFAELFERMDQRADERHREMDEHADERHREVIEAISALKAT